MHSPAPTVVEKIADGGFTLVELITVMLVISIIAVVAVPRLSMNQAFVAAGFHDTSQAMLRYAQKLAIAQRRDVYVNLVADTSTLCLSYTAADPACSDTSPTRLVADPQNPGKRFAQTAPGGVSLSAGFSAFRFTSLGQPMPDAAYTLAVTGDDMVRTITVERETGYVH